MYEAALEQIVLFLRQHPKAVIAIDGRCASGKSTLAAVLKEELNACVIHMDDFFLRPEQRSPERLAQPGGNVDRERFEEEVLKPLGRGSAFSYRPFDCHTMTLKEAVRIEPADLVIIEGTYSCHPALWDHYDLHIFMTVSPDEQSARIQKRNPDRAEIFFSRWIPMEEQYFAACSIESQCEIRINTDRKQID